MGLDAEIRVWTPQPIAEEMLKTLQFDIAEAFGASSFMLSKKRAWRAIVRVTGRDLWELPDPYCEGPLLNVRVALRYYDRGYERGDLVRIIAILDWLQDRLKDGKVFYGSNEPLRQWTPELKKELWDHFVLHGRKPYLGIQERGAKDPTLSWENVLCAFCYNTPMMQCGFGPTYAAFQCVGCGEQCITQDSGDHWEVF